MHRIMDFFKYAVNDIRTILAGCLLTFLGFFAILGLVKAFAPGSMITLNLRTSVLVFAAAVVLYVCFYTASFFTKKVLLSKRSLEKAIRSPCFVWSDKGRARLFGLIKADLAQKKGSVLICVSSDRTDTGEICASIAERFGKEMKTLLLDLQYNVGVHVGGALSLWDVLENGTEPAAVLPGASQPGEGKGLWTAGLGKPVMEISKKLCASLDGTLDCARAGYALTVVSLPPILSNTDMADMAAKSDAVIMVESEYSSRLGEIAELAAAIRKKKAHVLAGIFCREKIRRPHL